MGGWAANLLDWAWSGAVLTAEASRARYVLRAERHEVIAWGELRDVGGRRRIDIGSFHSGCPCCVRAGCAAACACRRS